MMKKILSLVLALALCLGLAAPAGAVSAGEEGYLDPARIMTAAQRDAEREEIARSIREAGGTVITEQETPTDRYCQERLAAMEQIVSAGGTVTTEQETPTASEAASYYQAVKGTPIFTPEQDLGAHYYAFSPYSTQYSQLFVNIKLPTSFYNADRRNGYLCVGVYGALGGIDLGLQNVGTGWRPYYWDTVGRVGGEYSAYTAPSSATNALVCVKPVDASTVYLYVQFIDSAGNYVGTEFARNLTIGSGNLSVSSGGIRCRYFRFASLVPKLGMTDDRADGSYMLGGKMTNCQLYNGTSYESWGISTANVSSAWKVYPECITLSWAASSDTFDISHS